MRRFRQEDGGREGKERNHARVLGILPEVTAIDA